MRYPISVNSSVHNVKEIKLIRQSEDTRLKPESTNWVTFEFIAEDGSCYELTAFVNNVNVEIEDITNEVI